MTWLGTALARHGYVAVAVDHPGTHGLEPITPEGIYAPWERADDLRRAIDRLVGDPIIGPRLDASRIGAAAFSLGGWTALLLAGARHDFERFRAFCASARRDAICEPQREYPVNFFDQPAVLARPHAGALRASGELALGARRIRSVLLLAPALGQALVPQSLQGIEIPLLQVAGDRDRVTPTATNAAAIAAHVPGASLRTLPNVGRYDFLSLCGETGRRLAAVYCTDAPGEDRERTHGEVLADALAFFVRTLR
jgi:predicted dienelactone hydrolase